MQLVWLSSSWVWHNAASGVGLSSSRVRVSNEKNGVNANPSHLEIGLEMSTRTQSKNKKE